MSNGSQVTFRKKNESLSRHATEVLEQERPMTLRQLYYRLISAGALRNQKSEYNRLMNVMTRLREAGQVPRTWIVDHVRATLKPSSWSGLADFGETVREAYRKDFWASLDHHVEVFVEKDAIAGTIQPVTAEYDVALRVCRGYSSVSFAGEIADLWAQIEKPIFAYYVGDYDPSGFDLERDLREKLQRYSGRWCWYAGQLHVDEDEWHPVTRGIVHPDEFGWIRLGIRESDFHEHNLIPLPVKQTDNRAKAFLDEHGEQCAEVDALPPNELRQRVREAIQAHIDAARWNRLLEVERLEQEQLDKFMRGMGELKVNLD